LLAVGALLLVFGFWWAYFKHPFDVTLHGPLRRTMWWAYAHYFVFGSVAALGAGLEVAVDAATHHEVSLEMAAWSVALPVVVYLLVLMRLDRRGDAAAPSQPLVFGGVVLILIAAGLVGVLGIGFAVLLMGTVVAALVTVTVALGGPQTRRVGDPAAAAIGRRAPMTSVLSSSLHTDEQRSGRKRHVRYRALHVDVAGRLHRRTQRTAGQRPR